MGILSPGRFHDLTCAYLVDKCPAYVCGKWETAENSAQMLRFDPAWTGSNKTLNTNKMKGRN